jgi:CRP/FNR family transcriptional regulator
MSQTNPFEAFVKSVKSICPSLTDKELEYLTEGMTVSELKSRHFYIHANTIQKQIGFINSGLIRSFYTDSDGNEITVNFIRENSYATHYSAFITQSASRYNFQCIEPTVILNLSYQHIQEGYQKFHNLERYGRLIAEEVLKLQQKRIESFLFSTAEERYLDFIDSNPDLFNRVSLSHLSTYLGIERQTLTRIRQKLAKI